MKIVYIPSWYPIGEKSLTGVFIREQIEAICPFLDKADVLYLDPIKGSFKTTLSRKKLNGVTLFYKTTPYFPKQSAFLFAQWCNLYKKHFKDYLSNEGKPDIIHAHGFLAALVASELSSEFQIPFGITLHDTSLIRFTLKTWKQKLLIKTIQEASFAISVSKYLKDKVEEIIGASSLQVVGNMVLDSFINFPMQTERNEVYTFGIIGSVDVRKQVHHAVEALHIINDKGLKLVIAGEGKEMKRIQNLIEVYQLGHQVEILSWVDREQLPDLIERIDCLLSLSTVETFGIILIEALAMGKFVIAYDSGGVRDIMNNDCGILIPEGRVSNLILAMQEIQRKKIHAEELRQYISENFSANVITNKILSLYKMIP